MENIIKTLIALVVAVTGGMLIFTMAAGALSGQEEFECNQWKGQASQYKSFYLTTWQKAQCDHHEITINAPVQ